MWNRIVVNTGWSESFCAPDDYSTKSHVHRDVLITLYKTTYSEHSFIDTNLIHNFLCKLYIIKFLYMIRASSAHLQEVNDVNCTCMQQFYVIYIKKLCIKLVSIKESLPKFKRMTLLQWYLNCHWFVQFYAFIFPSSIITNCENLVLRTSSHFSPRLPAQLISCQRIPQEAMRSTLLCVYLSKDAGG